MLAENKEDQQQGKGESWLGCLLGFTLLAAALLATVYFGWGAVQGLSELTGVPTPIILLSVPAIGLYLYLRELGRRRSRIARSVALIQLTFGMAAGAVHIYLHRLVVGILLPSSWYGVVLPSSPYAGFQVVFFLLLFSALFLMIGFVCCGTALSTFQAGRATASAERSDLLKAVIRGKREDLRNLLKKIHPDVERDTEGCTALMLSVRNDDLDTATLLIDSGADVNARSIAGNTPLVEAALHLGEVTNTNYSFPMIRLLMERGARINEQTSKSTVFIHLMLGFEDERFKVEELLAWLLDHGADFNYASSTGETPLMRAALLGKNFLVNKLLEHRADLAGVYSGLRRRAGNCIFL